MCGVSPWFQGSFQAYLRSSFLASSLHDCPDRLSAECRRSLRKSQKQIVAKGNHFLRAQSHSSFVERSQLWGEPEGHQVHDQPHLAQSQSQAAPDNELQIFTGCSLSGEVDQHRQPVSESRILRSKPWCSVWTRKARFRHWTERNPACP